MLGGGLCRQRVYQIAHGPTFPRPVADLAMGEVWDGDDVDAWINRYRKPAAG